MEKDLSLDPKSMPLLNWTITGEKDDN